MKPFLLYLLLTGMVVLGSCSNNDLTREKALDLIKQAHPYPQVWDYEIFTADPEEVTKLTDAGLESQGMVVLEHRQRLIDVGKPLVLLTGKSSSYLLPAQDKDSESKIVRVKAGEIDIVQVTGIKMLADKKKAIAEYTTQFKNLTPFAALRGMKADKTNIEKAYFSLYDDGWRIEKKPDLDFMGQ